MSETRGKIINESYRGRTALIAGLTAVAGTAILVPPAGEAVSKPVEAIQSMFETSDEEKLDNARQAIEERIDSQHPIDVVDAHVVIRYNDGRLVDSNFTLANVAIRDNEVVPVSLAAQDPDTGELRVWLVDGVEGEDGHTVEFVGPDNSPIDPKEVGFTSTLVSRQQDGNLVSADGTRVALMNEVAPPAPAVGVDAVD